MHSAKTYLLYPMALLYLSAGIAHFAIPEFFVSIVPPALPAPELINVISGLAELMLALGLLLPRTRRWAAWGVVALLIAVFPANIYMALEPAKFEMPPAALWGRLPLQFVLIAWAWWYTRPDGASSAN